MFTYQGDKEMKLVNTNNPSLVSHDIYVKIEQPMPIYHSTEELYSNEEDYEIIRKADLYNRYKTIKIDKEQYYLPIDKPTFIATEETFIPLSITKEGFKIYQLDGLRLRLTDNCFIRLYGILENPGGYRAMVTSTGLWGIVQDIEVSAGVPPKITEQRLWNIKLSRELRNESRDRKLSLLKTTNVAQVMDYKFLSRLLNPLASDSFLDPMKAAYGTYSQHGLKIPKKDLLDIISSERVQKLILKELQIIMPDLAEAIKAKIQPVSVATMLQKIADDTIKKDNASVQDKLMAVQAILNAGYPEEAITLNPQLGGSQMMMPMAGAIPQNLIKYEQPKIMGGDEVDSKPIPKDFMDDGEYKDLKEQAGYMEGTTFDDDTEFKPLNFSK